MKKVLLVNPDFHPDETRARALSAKLTSLPFLTARSFLTPLSLATVAALTPDDVDVDLWDEGVQGLIHESTSFDKDYDLVGITGYSAHSGRMKKLGRIFRTRGILVAAGGAGVSVEPEAYRNHFDVLFIGEAEYTWPRFVADWKKGSYRPEYRQTAKVRMVHSPPPRWDRMADHISRYLSGAVQTTRGCPFDCEFCDVVHLHGRQVRQKPIPQVLEEISHLAHLGLERVFFCDDNFIGNPPYTKALVEELVVLNRSLRRPLRLSTQISINVAKDDELLERMADANFTWLFIGIESPNIESLMEANKHQNYRTDMLADIEKIQGYGMPVRSGMIVGFDHDDTTVFDRQFEFLQDACIPGSALATLKAPHGTRLWTRLRNEERLVQPLIPVNGEPRSSDGSAAKGFAISPVTNIIPLNMTRIELFSGYRDLVQRVRDWRHFESRVRGMIAQIRRRPKETRQRLPWQRVLTFLRFVLFSMDPQSRRVTLNLFFYTWLRAPFMLEKVIGLIVIQCLESAQVPLLRDVINDQIALESTRGTTPFTSR
jgi:hypothetical protein